MRCSFRCIKYLVLILVLMNIAAPPAAAEISIMNDQLISGASLYPLAIQDGRWQQKPVGPHVLMNASSGGVNIPFYSNPTLSEAGWVSLGDGMPNLPAWAKAGQTWRPAIIGVDRGFLLYFSALDPSQGNHHCIGVASSDRLTGPYISRAADPLICVTDNTGAAIRDAIDPFPFVDEDGRLYLTWKVGGNLKKQQPVINISLLGPDGRTVVGQPQVLITNDQPWEGINVEAPYLMKRGGLYYLFYSGNLFQTTKYGVGYAVSSRLLGPYVKNQSNPILSSNGLVGYGPGEETLFLDSCGNSWLGFSDYDSAAAVGPPAVRHFHAVHLVWPDLLENRQNSTLTIDPISNFSICTAARN